MSVTTRHPQYIATRDTWDNLRAAYIGDAAIRTTLPSTRQGRQTATRTRYLPAPIGHET